MLPLRSKRLFQFSWRKFEESSSVCFDWQKDWVMRCLKIELLKCNRKFYFVSWWFVLMLCLIFSIFSVVNCIWILTWSLLCSRVFFVMFSGVSLAVDTPQHAKSYRGTTLSHAARTHVFKKLRAPSRCRECESYVYFQGAECQQVRAWLLVMNAATSENN